MVFGDFDADGLTGLAILVLALDPVRGLGRAVRSEPPRGGPRPVARRRSTPPSALGATVIVTVDCGTTSHAEIAAAASRGIDVIVTDHHRVPPDAAAGARGGQPAPAGLALPGPAPGGERRRVQGRAGAPRRRARRPGGGARPRRPRHHRDRRRRRADRRREPGDRPARARAPARGAPAGHRGAPRPRAHRPGCRRPRDRLVRARPAAQRGRSGRGGARGRPAAPGRDGRGRRRPRRRARGGQPRAARPDEAQRRRGTRPGR